MLVKFVLTKFVLTKDLVYISAGCIKDLTFTSDGKSTLYDLGNPADGENYTPGCNEGFVAAPVALNLDMSFLIAFIVVFAIVIVSVIVAAVYRRKQNLWS